jgi:Skp family chaperone for outer membrane proteins
MRSSHGPASPNGSLGRSHTLKTLLVATSLLALSACSGVYYNALEKVGVDKREVLVNRVDDARTAQNQAESEFIDALTEFKKVSHFDGGDLEKRYDKLKDAYEDAENRADEVRDRVDSIENVGNALFKEWDKEIKAYQDPALKRASRQKRVATEQRYNQLMKAMREAERSLKPALAVLNDQVMFLKHNLNAAALTSLKSEWPKVERDVNELLQDIRNASREAEVFLKSMKTPE